MTPSLRRITACVVAGAFFAAGCASKPQRDYSAELAAAPAKSVSAGFEQVYSAVVHAALDLGYSPALADRENGRFAGWMVGKLDPDKSAKAALYNVGAVVATTAAAIGVVTLSLLSGGTGGTPNFSGAELADDEVAVHLLVIVERRDAYSTSIRAVAAAPGSEPIEPRMTDQFWESLARRTTLQPPAPGRRPVP